MKKRILLFTLLLGGIFILSATAYANFSNLHFSTNDEEAESVELKGVFSNGTVRSLPITPFAVTKSADLITVAYLSNLNNISVSITDEYGETVYSNTINPVSGGQLLIDIFGWDTGNYTIHFSNSAGGHIWGNFEVSDNI